MYVQQKTMQDNHMHVDTDCMASWQIIKNKDTNVCIHARILVDR